MKYLLAALSEAQADGDAERMAIYIQGIANVLIYPDEQDTAEMPALACAWCLAENGQPMGAVSHGICPRHAAIVSAQSQARKAVRLANAA